MMPIGMTQAPGVLHRSDVSRARKRSSCARSSARKARDTHWRSQFCAGRSASMILSWSATNAMIPPMTRMVMTNVTAHRASACASPRGVAHHICEDKEATH